MLKLYNTLTRKIEPFKPLNPPAVTYYSCGPTVYDYAHLGHARTYIFADILERVLEYNQFDVKRVMNITDVGHLTSDSDTGEDKMEKGAEREKKSVWDIAKFYTDDFFEMLKKLNIQKPAIITPATEYIPQMITLVKKLEEKGFTYTISDGVYFDTTKFPKYGELTGQTIEKLEKSIKAGARIEIVKGKKHPTDFALWKRTPPGVKRQMEWDSPWGRGFPGWHMECSAMSMELLGPTLDIHTGGVDHIPIHHTNEIAQSEASTGKKFVNFWLHGEHLLIDGQKMSKSLGNFYRVKDMEDKGFDPLALRYLFMTAHYRTQMNFTWESLEGAANAYSRLKKDFQELNRHSGKPEGRVQNLSLKKDPGQARMTEDNNYKEKFISAINNDLNIPSAIALMWDLIKDKKVPDNEKKKLLLDFDNVLGLGLSSIKLVQQPVPVEIEKLAKEREKFRYEKNFKEADRVRKEIEEKGYLVEDTPTGTSVKEK
ncbi:cysteine--tRNA ligase [Candidatus Gottesmanbacteria bacterium RIFCSPHIGHO2_02_FULL_39_11]|uniref:Cysteine--tRNA ligase n=1 Tax=Candidatus Gottesmanbacteria bacterium RIFCSPHIGHO2_02_FULL_39_11 TaxID=1798382 RepID=A0A1F5ZXD0_9BACT|nr:MAG: cysteine--tRNA ligase [Candidatus Gottesmanbacteria bacterium RIFCSPHIGHO2_02_FULL_39_11]